MKILTIVGARPQFVKAAMISRTIRKFNDRLTTHHSPFTEVIVHTGQHYDYQMSRVFFDQLEIPEPNYHLEVGSGAHGDQTGKMLGAIERVLMEERPDVVLIHGDTNSTLAGALAAIKLHIPIGHVEGGMRSFNRKMPEEINRVLTDHTATWHFCPTQTAVENLKNEGITSGVHLVGDVMYEAVMLYKDIAREKSDILQRLGLIQQAKGTGLKAKGRFALCTIHRAENTDDLNRLRSILEALTEISEEMPVVLPLHPRTRKAIENIRVKDERSKVKGIPLALNPLPLTSSINIIEPLSYLDMLQLEQHASVILTDSGGIQKEAFWLGVPCVTMRDETEWIETVEAGVNRVVGADREAIISATKKCFNCLSRKNDCKWQNTVSSAENILKIVAF